MLARSPQHHGATAKGPRRSTLRGSRSAAGAACTSWPWRAPSEQCSARGRTTVALEEFRDAKSIIELLKENLTLWREEEEDANQIDDH